MELEKNVSNSGKSNAEPDKPNRSEKKIIERGMGLCLILMFLQIVLCDLEKILMKIGEILTYVVHTIRML